MIRFPRLQRAPQLPRGPVDVLDHPERLLELADRTLQLPVQHAAVGDDHDGVEDGAVAGVAQRRELVCKPGDRVAPAAPGGVLDQIALARTVVAGVGDHPSHGGMQ